jgi:hypothetical protein
MKRRGDRKVPAEVLAQPSGMAPQAVSSELAQAGPQAKSQEGVPLRATVAAGAAISAGLLGLHLVTLALVEAANRRLPRWASYSTVGVGCLGVGMLAAGYGWRQRPGPPMENTRASLRQLLRIVLDYVL